MKQYLVKFNTGYIPAIAKEEDNEFFITLDNMVIKGTETDPEKAILLTQSEIVKVIGELNNTVFDTKYTLTVPTESGVTTLPTAAELNTAYDTVGIPAIDLQDVPVILKRTADGTETDPVRQMNEGEGMLVILQSTGVFEQAGFSNDQWLIDQTKNELPLALADLNDRITVNENDINTIQDDIVDINDDIVNLQRDNNTQDGRISTNENDILVLGTRITTLDGDVVKKDNSVDVVSTGVIDLADGVTETAKLPTREDVRSAVKSVKDAVDINTPQVILNKNNIDTNTQNITNNKTEADATKITADQNTIDIAANKAAISDNVTAIAVNTAGVDEYNDNKADYVRLQDIEGAIDISANIVGVENGNDVTFDLSGLDLSKLTVNKLVVFQFSANNGIDATEYVSDSYNNATATSNIMFGDNTVQVLSTDTLLTISGLNGGNRDNLVNDYTLTLVSQLGGAAGAGVDQTARNAAAAAQTTADLANSKATTNTTNVATNTADIATLDGEVKNNKTEADATKTKADANETAIAANTAAIALKQNITDNSLSTTNKTIVGAINELKTQLAVSLTVGVNTPTEIIVGSATGTVVVSSDEPDLEDEAIGLIEEQTNIVNRGDE